MVRFLHTDERLLDTLKNGLSIPFSSPPSQYSERNNKSALDSMHLLRPIIKQWEDEGKVLKVKDCPWCINPLSVISQKSSETGQVKVRPVIDLSRHVNKFNVFQS